MGECGDTVPSRDERAFTDKMRCAVVPYSTVRPRGNYQKLRSSSPNDLEATGEKGPTPVDVGCDCKGEQDKFAQEG